MECSKVREALQSSRAFARQDGEGLASELHKHLLDCSGCQAFERNEATFDESVRQLIQAVEVPANLESRIQWRLRQLRRQQQRGRVLYWSLAAAALFLFAVGMKWYYQRPYDLARLHETIAEIDSLRPLAVYDIARGKQRSDLQLWLNRQGMVVSLPARLKLEHLTGAYIVEAGGRKVPVLELRAGSSVSKVCLLQRRFFNEQAVQQLRDQQSISSLIMIDPTQTDSIGWMIVEQGSAYLFVEETPPQNGV